VRTARSFAHSSREAGGPKDRLGYTIHHRNESPCNLQSPPRTPCRTQRCVLAATAITPRPPTRHGIPGRHGCNVTHPPTEVRHRILDTPTLFDFVVLRRWDCKFQNSADTYVPFPQIPINPERSTVRDSVETKWVLPLGQ
jgi:hypothetical protein